MKLAALPLLLLGACSPSALAAAPAPAPREAVRFRISSWGKPLSHWQLGPDGRGSYTQSHDNGGGFHRYRLVTRRVVASPAEARRIARLLVPARRWAGRSLPCGERATDLPYGEVSWGVGGRALSLAFDTGCRSAETARVVAALAGADAAMRALAAQGPVIATEEVGRTR